MQKEIKAAVSSSFNGIEDPRAERNQIYPFPSIMTIIILAGIAGMSNYTRIAEYAEAHYEQLKRILSLPARPPSHDTFRRIIQSIHPVAFQNCFRTFTQELKRTISTDIAIDGKTIRNSGEKPLHIVSAWCESNELVLAQQRTKEKSNEITAIPLLLDMLDLPGKTITIDAMGCQRKIAAKIVAAGGDYLLAVKNNQPTLYRDIKARFAHLSTVDKESFSGDIWHEYDKGHGRIAERTCYVTEDCSLLQGAHSWPGLQAIVKQVSKRTYKGKTSEEIRYYISSLSASASKTARSIRNHWGIENKLHWRLDVNLHEDTTCISEDNGAENMNTLKKLGLNIVVPNRGKTSAIGVQRKASMSWSYMLKLLKKAL